ncbi:hypothetical protein [Methylobacterium gnaphalii]|uniref:Uncharacterized protein n=1 Tax=Methylobacterium gnaphalii TaxID=1010610 RepID=A0A512JRT9_9HYPH|nr:hypothetical protein [Methylobacterium gnaphalii]GEP12670.1 hypothetical protein MGN01_45150 [Methylobacterium gnaphalii]GJD71378.1 hypothetical protein MMMDOFMJ_4334 [Methylobacterium gnaphalii]GLS51392.1 hypothetical protein GCM10007885_42490 [Methylobacterium gnaphalii]
MTESAPASEINAAPHAHLREALQLLEARDINIEIDGGPATYIVDGRPTTSGDVVAYAAMLTPAGLNVVQ